MGLLVALSACGSSDVRSPRGVYVTAAGPAISSRAATDQLRAFLRDCRMTHTTLYGLGPVLADESLRARLARFIDGLRAAGVEVGAPVAGSDRLEALRRFSRDFPDARFSTLVTEYEYWNAPAHERADRFAALFGLLAEMRAYADELTTADRSVRVGVYLGYPTRDEVQRLAGLVDFAYVNYPVAHPKRAWRYGRRDVGSMRDRLAWLVDAGIEVWPLLYARGEVHMGGWLADRDLADAERVLLADQSRDVDLAPASLGGFYWFAYPAATIARCAAASGSRTPGVTP